MIDRQQLAIILDPEAWWIKGRAGDWSMWEYRREISLIRADLAATRLLGAKEATSRGFEVRRTAIHSDCVVRFLREPNDGEQLTSTDRWLKWFEKEGARS